MTPLTENPTIVVEIDEKGRIKYVASNIAPNVKIIAACDREAFKKEAANQPFRSDVRETKPAFDVGYSWT